MSDLGRRKANARDKWLDENRAACNPFTLQCPTDPASQRQYLINRLDHAFCAGWDAAERDLRAMLEGDDG